MEPLAVDARYRSALDFYDKETLSLMIEQEVYLAVPQLPCSIPCKIVERVEHHPVA